MREGGGPGGGGVAGSHSANEYSFAHGAQINFGDLKIPSGQIGSAWEWYHWIGLKKSSTAKGFWFWIFEKTSKFWAASNKTESNLLLVWITVCMRTNRDLFPAKPCSKNAGVYNCSLDYGLWVEEFQHPAIRTKLVQHFGGFFHQIKVCQPIGRTEQAAGWINFWMKRLRDFEAFSNIQQKWI